MSFILSFNGINSVCDGKCGNNTITTKQLTAGP